VPPSFRAALQPVVQRADATGYSSKTRGMTPLCFPPIIEDLSFTRFCPWSGRQIFRLLFHWTRQEPMSLFLHDFTAWFSYDFRKVALEEARVSALRFQFHFGLQ
jgi:hypothetical protein